MPIWQNAGSPKPDEALHLQLHSRLLALPFAACARCVGDLLAAEGYENVLLAGRVGYRGRNKEGGYDLEASLPLTMAHRRVIVQLKQFEPNQRVFLRHFDELRGTCLRVGAAEAILVTTSAFSPTLRTAEAALRLQAGMLAPVHLIGSEELVERLIHHGIGIYQEGRHRIIDEAYFDQLAEEAVPAQEPAQNGRTGQHAPSCRVLPSHRAPARRKSRRFFGAVFADAAARPAG